MALCEIPTTTDARTSPESWARRLLRYAPAALVVGAFAPWLALHVRELSRRPHYEAFPLIVPGAIALGYRALKRSGRPSADEVKPSRGRSTLLGLLGLLVLAAGVLLFSPWLGAVAAVLVVLAAIEAAGGPWLVRRLLAAWAFLWLAIPPPRGPDDKMLLALQGIASRWSSVVLDVIGVDHVLDGNVIELVRKGGVVSKLMVEEACSGVNSLFTLVMGTLFLAAWTASRPARAVVLVAASVVWVLVGNVLRIVTIAVAEARWGLDLSHGWRHTVLGFVIFFAMLGLVFSTDRLFAWCHRASAFLMKREWLRLLGVNKDQLPTLPKPGRAEAPAAAPVGAAAPAVAWSTFGRNLSHAWPTSWAFGVAFGVLLLAQLSVVWENRRDLLRHDTTVTDELSPLKAADMPNALGALPLSKFSAPRREVDALWGEHSRIWEYQAGLSFATLAVDFPFVGWHDLTDCYKANGWSASSAPVVTDGPGGPAVEASFVRPDGYNAFLIFALADHGGRPVDPPQTRGFVGELTDRLGTWFRHGSRLGLRVTEPTYQMQFFEVTDRPAGEDRRREARAVFEKFRERVKELGPKARGLPS